MGVVVHNDHDSSGWLRTSEDHLTAEPHLSNIRSNVTSGVGSGHAAPDAQDSAQHGVGDSEGSSVAGDLYNDRPNPLVNTNGAERPSSVLGTGRQSHGKDSSHENHFPPRDTQPYSYKDSLANVRSTGQSNAVSERAPSNIPVHTTTRTATSDYDDFFRENESTSHATRDDDGDFVQYVKKTPRRYYLGGFLPSITEDKIARYVNRRGPTVTFVRIWHSKRNKRNVVIRLNIEDNASAALVESPAFWPRGVRCRPWLDRNERNQVRDATYRQRDSTHKPRERQVFSRSDVDVYNPFAPLRDQDNYQENSYQSFNGY